jgi:hypothetical protein
MLHPFGVRTDGMGVTQAALREPGLCCYTASRWAARAWALLLNRFAVGCASLGFVVKPLRGGLREPGLCCYTASRWAARAWALLLNRFAVGCASLGFVVKPLRGGLREPGLCC